MFLGKGEFHRGTAVVDARLPQSLGDSTGSTEICPDPGFKLGCAARNVLSSFDCLSHLAVDGHPVRASEHGTGAEERKGVVLRAGIVNGDVPEHVLADLLSEVDVDTQEVGIGLSSLNFGQETLEPTERGSITANPEEFDATKRPAIALSLTVPDILKDGRKRSDTNTGSDQNGNLDVENILSRGTERTVDADLGKTESAAGIKFHKVSTRRCILAFLGAFHGSRGHGSDHRWADAKTVAKSTCPVTDLSNVDGDIGIFGGRGDGERVPLEAGDFGNLDEKPLAGGVLEARLDDTQFHSTTGMHKDL